MISGTGVTFKEGLVRAGPSFHVCRPSPVFDRRSRDLSKLRDLPTQAPGRIYAIHTASGPTSVFARCDLRIGCSCRF